MKTVLSSDYKYKKIIADNLQDILDRRYIEISDDEYERVNNAITTYSMMFLFKIILNLFLKWNN